MSCSLSKTREQSSDNTATLAAAATGTTEPTLAKAVAEGKNAPGRLLQALANSFAARLLTYCESTRNTAL